MWTLIGLLSTIVAISTCSDPIVEISNGKIQGKILLTPNNKEFYAFRGIPFAKPPVGELRFKPPQRPDDWEGILDDSKADNICIQIAAKLEPNESEDCLYLHVYTPKLPNDRENVSLPVVYMVHGGGFVAGSADFVHYGPAMLMDHDVIMVSVQYRLGFLGFLATDDLVCPGNNGLKDIQFGLRWVQENIRSFGGDPNAVTLYGESSGGACVSYLLLGSNSEGLFRGAIQGSGSALGTWALQRNPRQLAYQFGNRLKPSILENTTSSEELINFLRTISVKKIKRTCVEMFGDGMMASYYKTFLGYVFSGVVEPEHDGAFITRSPYEKFESGDFAQVPTLIGINSEEGLFLANDTDFDSTLKTFDSQTELFLSPNMHITDSETMKEVGDAIRKIYVGDGLLQDNKGQAIKFFGDTTFVRSIIKQAQLQSKYTDLFFYEFAYSGEMGRTQYYYPEIPNTNKVVHGENVFYVLHWLDGPYSETDVLTRNRMLLLWANFIKYLNPTPEPSELLQNVIWPKISSDEFPYLLFNETLELRYDPKKTEMDEYQRLYDTYAVPPLDTF